MRKRPLRLPVAVGLKTTLVVQVWPLLRVVVLVQVPPPTIAKSPGLVLALLITRPLRVSVPPPVLLSVMVAAALVWPTVTEPKSTLAGATDATGVGVGSVVVPL